jgi:hypothetical protein
VWCMKKAGRVWCFRTAHEIQPLGKCDWLHRRHTSELDCNWLQHEADSPEFVLPCGWLFCIDAVPYDARFLL